MKTNNYHSYLIKIFRKTNAYFMGDELRDKLKKEFLVSDVAARKIIQRACEKGVISSSTPLTFGKGAFAYLKAGVNLNLSQYLEIVENRRPPLFRILNQMIRNKGIISYYEALKVASTPLKPSKSKSKLLAELINELHEAGFINLTIDSNNTKYLVLSQIQEPKEVEALVKTHQTKMIVDSMFLYDIINSFKKSNLIDNEEVVYRSRKLPSRGALHDNFVWDCFCYTKTSGINTVYGVSSTENNKQALVVMDVVISGDYSENDLQGFIARINVLLNNTKTHRKILPIIVFSEISPITLNKAQAFGILTYNIGTIYGEKVFDILDSLYKIKLKEVIKQSTDTENPIDLIKATLDNISSTGQESNLQNVKGDLFESLMFQLLSEMYPTSLIEQGRRIPNYMYEKEPEISHYEHDFIITSLGDRERIIVEVKGFKSSSTIALGDYKSKNTVKWFFNRTYCSAKSFFSNDKSYPFPVKACYITTAQFKEDSIDYMNTLNSCKSTKLDLYYDNVKLLAHLDSNYKLKKIKEVLLKYYIDEV